MQEDMHFYGTYAMARAAGIPDNKAKVIAYAAQYVDDSTANDSDVHDDGGMFETVATAHTNREAIGNAMVDHSEQRKVWVPFHFFPGNETSPGNKKSFSERLICRKDSALAQEMVRNHIAHAVTMQNEYGLALLGIMAHVYADTFAHYGFSGVSSRWNKVEGESFELDVQDPSAKAYIMGKFTGFMARHLPRFFAKNYRNIASEGASAVTGALGHGAVGTYPDRPFLKWRFNYKKENRDSGWRDNPSTYIEACEKLHGAFGLFAKDAGISANDVAFEDIRNHVDDILRLEVDKKGRISAWQDAIGGGKLFTPTPDDKNLFYSDYFWEQQKDDFVDMENSHEMIEKNVYRFHQAAGYHRHYTLNQLLPRHGILVL